jgi:hypothetical protein
MDWPLRSKSRAGCGGSCLNPSYLGGRGRRIEAQGWSRQKHESLSEKPTKAKRAGDMTQVVEHLPSKPTQA